MSSDAKAELSVKSPWELSHNIQKACEAVNLVELDLIIQHFIPQQLDDLWSRSFLVFRYLALRWRLLEWLAALLA